MRNDFKSKNVLFLFHDSEKNNGANKSMTDIINYLLSNNIVKPYVVFPKSRGSAIEYFKGEGIETYCFRFARWDYRINSPYIYKMKKIPKSVFKFILTIPTFFKLKKIIKEKNIQIVYTNTYTIFLGCLLKKYCNISHVWHIREFGEKDHGLGLIFGKKIFYRCLNEYTDKIIFISKSLYNNFISNIDNKEKVEVLYNDLSPNNIQVKNTFNSKNKLEILIAGTLQKGKCQKDVIKAIEILKNKNIYVHLNIAGKKEGNYYKELIDYVNEKKLDDVISFNGYINDMKELRRKMDIEIVASSSEAFGRVTIEGMLSCLLMIGADSAGTSELIDDGKTGYLYPTNDYKKLAEVLEFINNNREKINEISTNGFNYAEKNFTVWNTGKRIGKILKEL